MTQQNLATLSRIKEALQSVDVKKRFEDMLGARASQFVSSLTNCVSQSKALAECSPNSIISSALVAASFDLPIDPNLGFAALVPYNSKTGKHAQFQMMAKGFIQLAIRSGQYEGMNYAEIYEDELKKYNPITKEIEFNDTFRADSQRSKGEFQKIVGYYAWFRLKTGYSQSLYMPIDEIRVHAKKYSMSYRYDLANNTKSSRWSTDFDVMAKKTVIKLMLSKWGILSIDIQRAISDDQRVFETESGSYADNEKDVIDVAAVENPFPEEQAQIEQQPTPASIPLTDPVPQYGQTQEPAPQQMDFVGQPEPTKQATCYACNAKIDDAVKRFSEKKWGKPLCRKCQEFQA